MGFFRSRSQYSYQPIGNPNLTGVVFTNQLQLPVVDLDTQARDNAQRLAQIEQEAALHGVALSGYGNVRISGGVISLQQESESDRARRVNAENLNDRYAAELAIRERVQREQGGFPFGARVR